MDYSHNSKNTMYKSFWRKKEIFRRFNNRRFCLKLGLHLSDIFNALIIIIICSNFQSLFIISLSQSFCLSISLFSLNLSLLYWILMKEKTVFLKPSRSYLFLAFVNQVSLLLPFIFTPLNFKPYLRLILNKVLLIKQVLAIFVNGKGRCSNFNLDYKDRSPYTQ